MALRLPAIMKTTAARLSALYFLLFALCAVLLVFYMTSLSARMLTAQTMETINEEVQGLDRAYQRGGLPFLVRVVEQRSRQPGANLYLIADANGRILTGNVESLEPGVLEMEGWTERAVHLPALRRRHRRAPGAEVSELEAAACGDRGQACGDRARLAPAQPDDRAGRPRPRRAGAFPRRRARALMFALGMMAARRAADLVFRRPARAEAHRQRFRRQPAHHGRRPQRAAAGDRRRRRVRPAVGKPQHHADQDRRV